MRTNYDFRISIGRIKIKYIYFNNIYSGYINGGREQKNKKK